MTRVYDLTERGLLMEGSPHALGVRAPDPGVTSRTEIRWCIFASDEFSSFHAHGSGFPFPGSGFPWPG